MRPHALAALFALTACGGFEQANVAACNQFVSSAKCGTHDLSTQYDCATFNTATCDVTGYFTCLSTHYVCVSGQYDASQLSTVSACDSEMACR
jgi:hypothetical protein